MTVTRKPDLPGDDTVLDETVDQSDGVPEPLAVNDPGRYDQRETIAAGGMGSIVRARDRRLGRTVAIKQPRPDAAHLADRIEREALLIARLQHPSIVDVHDAGRWPSGDPFYSMRLVRGRPLDQVVAAAGSLDGRLALLPHVLAVVDALAYAHQQRVIHRDLKPQNILVGEFGETIVIDWGLAKDLAAGSADGGDPSAAGDRAGSGPHRPGVTTTGTVLGTLDYMPPEQALGEPVDERADVFALGAVLYHVLAGHAPHESLDFEARIEAAREGTVPPLAGVQPGIPPDLLAIVEHAMAPAIERRYPTAGAMADDLRRFQTGQLVATHRYSRGELLARWLKRHLAAVAVAGVSIVVLAAVGATSVVEILRERDRTRAALVLAERNRADAEDIMDFMMVDLRHKLEELGKLSLLESVARTALDYRERRAGPGLPENERKRAAAHDFLAVVLESEGDLERSLEALRAAEAIREALAAADPDSLPIRRELARSYGAVGLALMRRGDLAAAAAKIEASLKIRERVALEDPEDDDVRRELARGYTHLGHVYRNRGNLPAARAAFDTALRLTKDAARRRPEDPLAQRDLSLAHHNVAWVLLGQGDTKGSLDAYRAGLEIRERLLREAPDDRRRLRDVEISLDNVGDVLYELGDRDAALDAYLRGQAISESLSASDPGDARQRGFVAIGHEKIGKVRLAAGDTAGALRAFRESLRLRAEISAADPTNADRAHSLASGHEHMASALLKDGDVAGAVASYRRALVIRRDLVAHDPENATRRRGLSLLLGDLGDALARGKPKEALAAYRESVTLAEALAATDPSNVDWTRGVADGKQRLGELLLERGDAAGALREAREALAVREPVLSRMSEASDAIKDQARSHALAGRAQLASGDREGALASYRAALALFEPLAAADPEADAEAARLREAVEACCRQGR